MLCLCVCVCVWMCVWICVWCKCVHALVFLSLPARQPAGRSVGVGPQGYLLLLCYIAIELLQKGGGGGEGIKLTSLWTGGHGWLAGLFGQKKFWISSSEVKRRRGHMISEGFFLHFFLFYSFGG